MNETDTGYSINQQVFERAEMTRVLEALDQAPFTRTRAGARHLLRVPVVRELATDPRLLLIAAHFVGSNPVPFRATLFDKSQASNWLSSGIKIPRCHCVHISTTPLGGRGP